MGGFTGQQKKKHKKQNKKKKDVESGRGRRGLVLCGEVVVSSGGTKSTTKNIVDDSGNRSLYIQPFLL